MTRVTITAQDVELRTAAAALRKAADDDDGGGRVTTKAAALRLIAGAIESQTPKPRMHQPPIYGLVEASCVHADSRGVWVRNHKGWLRIDVDDPTPDVDDWDSLIDPRPITQVIRS